MKIAMIIVRTLMGLLFLFASIVVLLNLVPKPPMEGIVKTFNEGIEAVGYLLPLIKVTELLCGIAFVTGRFVPLATVLIAPIIVNIFMYHAFVDRTGLPVAIFLVLANIFVAYYYRAAATRGCLEQNKSVMFSGFTCEQIKTQETTINLVCGGAGYPVLLLHGYPETHFCWHLVAPMLAERFTVVCTDLRGYGDSGKPASDPEHRAYSKRVMAQDQVEVMENLGFREFAVVGHDRGARVAHQIALDHTDKITKLALLDIIPTRTAFANVDKEMATSVFNWFFSIQPDGLPERLIGAEPEFYLQWILDHWHGGELAPEAIAEYQRCFNTETIRATCEEFRAAATIDLFHDEADKGTKVSCPTLLLWSSESWTKFDVLETWKLFVDDVQGHALDCGHFLPEEDPERTAAELMRFLL